MEEQANISLYKIKSCGFYKRGEKNNAQFGDLQELLSEVRRWGSTKELENTKTYEATENASLPAYLVDIRGEGNNWLLTLWNEIESTDGAIASIAGNARVGRADATLTELDEGAIPGYATYFWFLSDRNLLATVRVNQRSAGHFQMNRFLQGFLEKFSSHVVLGEENVDEEVNILGYREREGARITKFRPRFKSELLTKAGALDFLRERVLRISKIVQHGTLILNDRQERQLWQKMLDRFGLTEPAVRPFEVKMNFDMDVDGVTEEEFDRIVEDWAEEDDPINRYGFRIRGDAETYWLDRQYVKDAFMLDIDRKPGGIIEPDSLLRGLMRHRANVVALIRR
ncbi:hypothetical protein [uncultured Pseudacidovorax sp.]|uniref:hypothetical protein n=1 Tax=uncultured Pseudacidovorax sp. TaxID=679313 RepID=UPI0025E730C7|nr:hypothetical protein [uncultured Pseudacidovorax sp.]